MNHTETRLPGLTANLTAHALDKGASLFLQNEGLLLARLTALEPLESAPRTPLKIAIVIDRSGSMAREKLAITKLAVARFIRSLDPDDRVSIVAYDENVDLICGLEAPSETLAQNVEQIESGGSTNLYSGWVTGAKVVGQGGRVILLSDGQANAGRYRDAGSLGTHAAISYGKYAVTTTTIGVGRDYDEGLMATMAREGGGAHYFAHTAEAIMDAFGQERYSASSVALERLSIRCGDETVQLGHFWGGESKSRVFSLPRLEGLEVTLRYTDRASGERQTYRLDLPTSFGYSEEVTLEFLLQRAGEAEGEMLRVRDPRSAGEMREQLRSIVLELLAHPMSDQPEVVSVVNRLNASIERLQRLERNYVEQEAMMHRKRSMQSSHNLRERSKAFTSFEDEMTDVRSHAMNSLFEVKELLLESNDEVFKIVPLERWIEWKVLPLRISGTRIDVAMENPRDGFLIAEIEKETGLRVKSHFAKISSDEIVEILKKA